MKQSTEINHGKATGSIFDDTPMGQWRRDMAKHTYKGKTNPFMFRLAQEALKNKGHEPVYARTTYGKSMMPMKTTPCPKCGVKHGFYAPEEKERECGVKGCDGKMINPFHITD